MVELMWIPWHQVVHLRDDLRSGELSLASFAADLYEVAMQKGRRPIYEDPAHFFALTYPTYNLRELAKDVLQRLAGQNDKAIRQLELTYGGGKTHTLITLFHLVNDPAHLPDLPAVQEFVQHSGLTSLPQARVALLPFDKLDVEKGMEIRGPEGGLRWLKHPWSVIAYQIAGDAGLRLLHAEGEAEERESAPAENLLVDLLRIPETQGLATLILIDEVLMFAREKVGLDPAWRGRLLNFFQYLTQAVTRVDRCAIVASLLATDPRKSDTLGKQLIQELYAIFRREREEGVQPVLKEDVAEVLRRRFFTPDSIQNREAFKSHVVAALKGISALDEQTAKAGKSAEARFLQSYPFHPDLTEVFYTKWTNLEGFQRTRGVLRTFALALREAEAWDTCPLIGPNVFLSGITEETTDNTDNTDKNKGKSVQSVQSVVENRTTDNTDFTDKKKEKSVQSVLSVVNLSEAARELTGIAETEEYEGKRQEWSAILLGELEKARAIQQESPGLAHREIEQAVFATFMHSQPIGQKALTRDLFLLLGQTRPDPIELEKALQRWVEVSWFLDEDVAQAEGMDAHPLPRAWRLGSRPNLTQMHHAACENRVSPDLVQAELRKAIESLNSLTAGAKGPGARVHNLPHSPNQVGDEGDFHYVILPPEAACDPGQPHAFALRFWQETSSPGKPRVNKNALLLVAPSPAGLAQAEQSVRHYLGWVEVQTQLKKQQPNLAQGDPLRWQTLLNKLTGAKKLIPSVIRQAYTTVITMSVQGTVEAFKVSVGNDALFSIIKADTRARIQETAVDAEALLPGGPYQLWHTGETERWLKDLVGAFAQHPHLPKMLNRQAILNTLVQGCEDGLFVFRLERPDGSARTFWRYRPDDAVLKEPSLEVVLPEAATLSKLASSLLEPGALPGLWPADQGGDPPQGIDLQTIYDYFGGEHVVMIQKQGYEEPLMIPAAPREVVNDAVGNAVENGKLWLLSGPASVWQETIPVGVLAPSARLLPPPAAIAALDLVPPNLPEAWLGEITSALAISTALASKAGHTLPWPLVRQALDDAFHYNYLERTPDSGPWPCEAPGAQNVKVRVPQHPTPPPPPPPPPPDVHLAEADLQPHELQDLADAIGDIAQATVGYDLKLHMRIELDSLILSRAKRS